MKNLIGLTLVLFLGLLGCENGSKIASTPNNVPYDCFAYGNCGNSFGPNAFGNQYPNFSPYGIGYGQSPYINGSGFSGCQYSQYPVFYPNYGYVCVNQAAFATGANYGTWNYQPSSYEFLAASGYTVPNYYNPYNYNGNFAFQGCTFTNSNCGCQALQGVPNQFGICAHGSFGFGF